ncbi:MAG: hypothetical protein KatS3mg077_3284 [Candidatus Binatia bacterium]|nr:MAG: hypothetical protein KatS3mg077_3284 [Candidatus Binatia bacterium]
MVIGALLLRTGRSRRWPVQRKIWWSRGKRCDWLRKASAVAEEGVPEGARNLGALA